MAPALERSSDDTPDLLTSDEVMQRLLADANLRRRAATCVLPAVRLGSEWRFRKTDLEAWIQGQVDVSSAQKH